MLLSFGILRALHFLSSAGDGVCVCVYDHFISFSSQDSFLLKTQYHYKYRGREVEEDFRSDEAKRLKVYNLTRCLNE